MIADAKESFHKTLPKIAVSDMDAACSSGSGSRHPSATSRDGRSSQILGVAVMYSLRAAGTRLWAWTSAHAF
ncbi:hypothetical protein, partial [Streptomyces sp. SM14]|uniref:hypothetical protein n=1 Tax=Streptomyces sp. SM14 TaxID=1736045 RepID=UPI0035BC715F